MQYAPVVTDITFSKRVQSRLVPLDCIVCSTTIVSPLVICTECLHAWAAWLVAKAPSGTGWRWRRKVTKFYLTQYGPSVPGLEREAARLIDAALRRAARRSPMRRRTSRLRQVVLFLGAGIALGLGSVLLLSILITFSILIVRLTLLL